MAAVRCHGVCARSLIGLGIFVAGLYWVVVYKDERDELGAQEQEAELEDSTSVCAQFCAHRVSAATAESCLCCL